MLLSPVSYFAFALINTQLNLAVICALVNPVVVAGAALVDAIVSRRSVGRAKSWHRVGADRPASFSALTDRHDCKRWGQFVRNKRPYRLGAPS
ncbi:hypothetical protein [Mesorhizobium sp. GbtcB19]|uniref:hypothetical protein n=1 Tax=Mesorhizobium sp. GbtcB19 TaxID=2824764 RepID=UPI0020C5CE9B|nr:hypothetical protein [Mesorhizobium sp. GbtcB19]